MRSDITILLQNATSGHLHQLRVPLCRLHEVSQHNEVPGVSVGEEWQTPHAGRDLVSIESSGYVHPLHYQLCVDVPQYVGHSVAAGPPHPVTGVVVVMEVGDDNL